MRASTSVVFASGPRYCTLTVLSVALHWPHMLHVDLREIFEYVHLKFTVSGRSKQAYTHTCAMQSRWCGARSGSPQLRRKTENSRHVGVQDRSFYGDLHEMSDILIMLLICIESDKIPSLHKQLYKHLPVGF